MRKEKIIPEWGGWRQRLRVKDKYPKKVVDGERPRERRTETQEGDRDPAKGQ